ncbi:MAG: fumarate hydratase [Actinobacteria bacterium]|nr:fumarate hydratase [Actinomycetota bacterium]
MTGENLLKIEELIRDAYVKINIEISEDIRSALERSLEEESLARAKEILGIILKNGEIARKKNVPLCQDTGAALIDFYLDSVPKDELLACANRAVSSAVEVGKLRPSIVRAAFTLRENTGRNTPVFATFNTVISRPQVYVMARGGGSENASALFKMNPTTDQREIENVILRHVSKVAPGSCPPLIIGICFGGMSEQTVLHSRLALFREVGSSNPNSMLATMEKDMLNKINGLDIGPGGTGGVTTTLAVHMTELPTHIACLPVAVSVSCHSLRRTIIDLPKEWAG